MKLKSLLAAVLLPLTQLASGAETRTETSFEERLVLQNQKQPITQSVAKYGLNRISAQTSQEQNSYGLNLENQYLRLNAGFRDSEIANSDAYKIAARIKSEKVWFEIENDQFKNPDKENSTIARISLTPIKPLEIQASADRLENWRTVVFYQTGPNTRVGIGGGQNKGRDSEGEVFASTKITDNYNARGGVRVGENDIFDARLRFGRNSPTLKGVNSYDINPGDVNDLSKFIDPICRSSDLTYPYAQTDNFSFLGAENQVGDKTGDVGGDIRYTQGKSTYARFAINIGDYWKFKDVLIVPGVHRNLETKKNGLDATVRTDIGPFRIAYRTNIDEDTKPEHAFLIGVSKSFGGKK